MAHASIIRHKLLLSLGALAILAAQIAIPFHIATPTYAVAIILWLFTVQMTMLAAAKLLDYASESQPFRTDFYTWLAVSKNSTIVASLVISALAVHWWLQPHDLGTGPLHGILLACAAIASWLAVVLFTAIRALFGKAARYANQLKGLL